MHLKYFSILLILAFCLCLSASPAKSQNEGETSATIEGSSFPVAFKSHELSDFTVVSHFFRRLSMTRKHEHVYQNILMNIEIQPGSQEAKFIADVTDRAIEVLNAKTVDPSKTGDSFEEHQYAALRVKAGKLGTIYRNLLLGLTEAGYSTELLEAYCEKEIRPSINSFSTETDNSRYFEALSEFTKQLENM